jgi:hypothetical protein
MKIRVLLSCLALISILSHPLATAHAQGTAFTYQGRLDDGVNPAAGVFDLRFTLYDSAGAGSAVGGPVTNSPTSISNGLFTVTLDFGNQFPGAGRWLEIGVRTNGIGAFATLSPRQQLTSTPYAVRAATANTASSVAAANITGTIPLAQLPSSVVTNGASGVNITGTFSGNAGGLSNLNSAELTGPLRLSFGDPLLIGHTNNGGGARGVAVSGNYAYLANWNDGLQVYDISNPATPVNIGHIDNGGTAYGVAVSGNYAYLANDDGGLRVYDISNPATPVNIGLANNGGNARGVAVSGNYAYLANDDDGLRVYDISNPANPVNIGHTSNGGEAVGVAVSGNYAYLANHFDGLRVYDISNPANPVNIGHTSNDGNIRGVAVSGNYAYLANFFDGLWVYALGVVRAGSFHGDGSGLTGLNASQLTSGILGNARLSTNVSLLDSSIESAEITDGTIINADINAAAEIADTKLATISTTGKVADSALSTNVALRSNGNNFTGNQTVTNGNVGIGTTSSAKLLQVGGDLGTEGMMRFHSTSTNGGTLRYWDIGVPLGYQDTSGRFYSFVIDDPLLDSEPEFLIRFDTGFVGIGTNSPASRLHVAGTVTATAMVGDGSGLTGLSADNISVGTLADGRLSANVTKLGPTIESTEITDGAIGDVDISASAAIADTKLATISTAGKVADSALSADVALRSSGNNFTGNQTVTSGNVGIGTTSPTAALDVVGGTRVRASNPSWAALTEYNDYTDSTFRGFVGMDGIGLTGNADQLYVGTYTAHPVKIFTANTERLVVDGGGNVGIGNANPTNKLMVVNARCDGSSWINASDRNLKQDFAAVDAQAVLDKVAALPIQSWSYKAQPDQKHVGPVAQDFRAAFGLGQDDTSIATVDADGVALAAIQGLNQKLELTRAELRRRDAENAALQARLEKLEQLFAHRLNGGVK